MNKKPRINEKLKLALWKRKISQRELAFLLGVHEARVSKIIRGFEQPSNEIKNDIAKILEMDVDELFDKIPLRW